MSVNGGRLVHGELSGEVIGVFYRVYNKLGAGFLEAPYVLAMERELRKSGLQVAREAGVRIYYDGDQLCQYRLDMIVNEKLVLEIKSSHELHKNAERQLYNYLKASNLEVGLLLHFGPKPTFRRLFCPNARKPGIAQL